MNNNPDYRHRSVTLLNVPAYLAARSIDPIELLRSVNVPASFFSDLNSFIPREMCFALEDLLTRVTGDGILGGHVAKPYQLSELGPWGDAILAATTLREALSFAISQIHILQTGFTLAPYADGSRLVVTFRYDGRSAYHPAQHLIGSAVVVRKIALLAEVPEAVEVWMRRRYSAEIGNLDEMLGTRIRFGAPHDAVVIDLGILDGALPGRRRQVRTHVQTAWEVTSHIRTLLPYKRVTKDYVASLLGTSPRTVQRRLSEWGLSFEQLIDDVRQTEAMRLINDTSLTISDIAAMVGYSDAPHFVRAFRRWTGTTPVSLRRSTQQEPVPMQINGAPA